MKQFISILTSLLIVTSANAALYAPDKAELGMPKNYIANGGIERGLAGFKTYANTAQSTPVNGTGGSPSHITIASTTSSPLKDTTSLNIVNSGSTSAQGEGVSYDFTIDSGDQASVLNVSFDYSLVSGTFVAGSIVGSTITDSDLEVYLYDVTNSQVIQPAGYILTCGAVVGTICTNPSVQFQTASNSTSYRLIFHVATAHTSAWTMKVDNIVTSRQLKQYGSPITDSVSYNASPASFGTVTGSVAYYKRQGDKLVIEGSFTTGTTAASLATISIPSGLTIDSNKVGLSNTTSAAGPIVGEWVNNGTGNQAGPMILALGTSNNLLYFSEYSLSNPMIPKNGNAVAVSSALLSFKAVVPIAGWSSNVQMSDSANISTVIARAHVSTGTSTTAANPFNFDTVDYDSSSSITTGASWKFTAPIAGYYKVSGSSYTGSAINVTLYKNGSPNALLGTNNTTESTGISSQVQLNAGDTIDVRPSNTATPASAGGVNSVATSNYIAIERISVPQTIGANETVSASYFCSTNQSASATTPINFDSKEYDDHNMCTTGASWSCTVPVAGLYSISGSESGSGTHSIMIYKNGSAYKMVGGSATATQGQAFGADIRLNAGDAIQLRPDQAITYTGGTLGTAHTSNISIKRIGL